MNWGSDALSDGRAVRPLKLHDNEGWQSTSERRLADADATSRLTDLASRGVP